MEILQSCTKTPIYTTDMLCAMPRFILYHVVTGFGWISIQRRAHPMKRTQGVSCCFCGGYILIASTLGRIHSYRLELIHWFWWVCINLWINSERNSCDPFIPNRNRMQLSAKYLLDLWDVQKYWAPTKWLYVEWCAVRGHITSCT